MIPGENAPLRKLITKIGVLWIMHQCLDPDCDSEGTVLLHFISPHLIHLCPFHALCYHLSFDYHRFIDILKEREIE